MVERPNSFFTGHSHLRFNIQKIGIGMQSAKDDETLEDFLCECPAFSRLRWVIFQLKRHWAAELETNRVVGYGLIWLPKYNKSPAN